MRARGAAIQGALAAAGLVAAYLTWQRGPEEVHGDVVALETSKSSLQKIRYVAEAKWLELFRGSDHDTIWVKTGPVDPSAPVAAVDAGVAAASVADAGLADGGQAMASALPPPPPEPPKELRGNARAEKVLERFAPLRASRALGVLSPEKLKELGLEATTRRLEVVTAGGTRVFKVSVPPEGIAPYVQDEGDGKVYLLSSTLLSELNPHSQQLVEMRLHSFAPRDFDALTVHVATVQRELVHTAGETPQSTKVAAKATPDQPDEFARNWHDKVWTRLFVTKALGRGELPSSGEPKVGCRIEYFSRGKSKGWLELAQGAGSEMWARSELTAGWVQLDNAAAEILTEAAKVASGG